MTRPLFTFIGALIALRVTQSFGDAGHFIIQGALEGVVLAAVYVSGGQEK